MFFFGVFDRSLYNRLSKRSEMDVWAFGHRRRRKNLSVGALWPGTRSERALPKTLPGRLRRRWVKNKQNILIKKNLYNACDPF